MNIGYKLVHNATPTADKAPYLGMAIPVGSLAYDNILKDMVAAGTKMTLPTAKFFLDAFYEFAAERIAEEVVRINTGTVAIYPMIDGSFDSEDADFDPERNSLYIGATLSQSLRDRVAGIVPDATGDETKGTVKMDRIYDIESQTRGVISGTSSFRISGRNLTVPDGDDESLALYAKDGVTKVADITVSETDEGQRIICQLSAAVGIPKGTYKVRLASHGLDPTDPLTVATLTVTLVEAVPPALPKVTIDDIKAVTTGYTYPMVLVKVGNVEAAEDGCPVSVTAHVSVNGGEETELTLQKTGEWLGVEWTELEPGDTVKVTVKVDPSKIGEYDPTPAVATTIAE